MQLSLIIIHTEPRIKPKCRYATAEHTKLSGTITWNRHYVIRLKVDLNVVKLTWIRAKSTIYYGSRNFGESIVFRKIQMCMTYVSNPTGWRTGSSPDCNVYRI